jgi:hypothetical protein
VKRRMCPEGFPLIQGPKVRGIDDLTESGVNFAFGTSSKLWLMDIDSIAATIRLLEDIIVKGLRQVTLRNGDIETFRVHHSWLQVGENFFLQVSLPFGARGSVNPFNRASRLLWVVDLDIGLIWLNFSTTIPLYVLVMSAML